MSLIYLMHARASAHLCQEVSGRATYAAYMYLMHADGLAGGLLVSRHNTD